VVKKSESFVTAKDLTDITYPWMQLLTILDTLIEHSLHVEWSYRVSRRVRYKNAFLMLAKILIKFLVLLTCTWVRACWHKVYIPYVMKLSLVRCALCVHQCLLGGTK